MSRIRTVKPELFRHEELFEAEQKSGLPLRFIFIGLFTAADAQGRFRWKPRLLKLDILPYDLIEFEQALEALEQFGFIKRYEHSGQTYGYIPTWAKHQHINQRESRSQLPPPPLQPTTPVNPDLFIDVNLPDTLHVPAPDESVHAHGEMEEEREKEKEKEMEEEGKITAQAPPAADAVVMVFEYWQRIMDHPKAVLDKQRRRFIRAALDNGYSVEDLYLAIKGCSLTPHNRGHNERGERYDGLHLILRSADQIDRFIRNAQHPPKLLNKADQRLQGNIDAAQTWLQQEESDNGQSG